jgi:hypothetical protein
VQAPVRFLSVNVSEERPADPHGVD